MKKKYLSLFIIVLFICEVSADASIGSVEVQTDAVLSTGQRGLIITVKDIILTDYSGSKVLLAVNVYENDSQTCYPNAFKYLEVSERNSKWDSIELEIVNHDLQKCLDTGTKKVYFIAVLAPENPETPTEIIPGSNTYLETTLFIRDDSGSDLNSSFLTSQTVSLIEEIKNKYNLDIYSSDNIPLDADTLNSYTFSFNSEENAYWLNRSVLLFYEFINTLPVQFIKATQIEGVLFINKVYFEDLGEVGGGFSLDSSFIFLGNYLASAEMLEHVFLHELFHVLDKRYIRDGFFENSKWMSFNPPGTEYMSVHEMYEKDLDFAVTEYPLQGFVTGYCFADVYQGKAETFSYMLSPSLYPKLIEWIKDDPYLSAKVESLKEEIIVIFPSLEVFFDYTGL